MSNFNPSVSNSRRRFLQAGMTGVAAAVAAGSGLSIMKSRPALAQSPTTCEGALQELMNGNSQYVAGNMTSFDEDLVILRQHLESKQEPFAAVLSCADSRVPIEIIFNQTMGRLFGARLAGNMVTPEAIASLEYGVAVLGVKLIMVLGHSDCGAVTAAIAAKPVPGEISALYQYLRPAVDLAGPDLQPTTEANAKIQAHLLSESSTVVAAAIKEGQIEVVAAYFDIGSGVVTLLN